jgi:ribonuclease HI
MPAQLILLPDSGTEIMAKSKNKYYVVWVGRQTGIFTDWEIVQPLVKGYPAQYKSYATAGEADAAHRTPPDWVKIPASGGISDANVQKATEKKSKPRARVKLKEYPLDPAFDVHIFSDGGCEPNPGDSGSGVVVYQNQVLTELWYGGYHPMGTNNTAELKALHKALIITEEKLRQSLKVQVLSDSLYSVKAMNLWASGWQRKNWCKADGEQIKNKELIEEMYELFARIRDHMALIHVKGHSGVEGNELADRLSLMAIHEKAVDFVKYDGLESTEKLLAYE